jgi:hypothetical protein
VKPGVRGLSLGASGRSLIDVHGLDAAVFDAGG